MEITVSSRHTEVSQALRDSATEKIDRLGRFLEGMDHAEIHFSEHRSTRNPDREVCEVTMRGHGHHIRCKVAAPDGFAAVDRAVEKLEHQLHKLKTKLVQRSHSNGKRLGRDDAPSPVADEPEGTLADVEAAISG
ncbi:MAG: ribosome-associated translation inhibitor RaiA, partial [Acidimicrobiales bacterium]